VLILLDIRDILTPTVIDDNKASFVPESETRASYHCPRTNCDGHFYLRPTELGRELLCEKCGLPVTIGQTRRRNTGASREASAGRTYRLGFQRVYAVCAFLWIAAVLALAIRDRPRTIDYDALANFDPDAFMASRHPSEQATKFIPPPVSSEIGPANNDRNAMKSKPFVPPPVNSYKGDAPEDKGPLRIVKSEPLPGAVREYWIARSAITILPPLVIYLFIFVVLPWVHSGFIPKTRN
jgi:hypothetical protein